MSAYSRAITDSEIRDSLSGPDISSSSSSAWSTLKLMCSLILPLDRARHCHRRTLFEVRRSLRRDLRDVLLQYRTPSANAYAFENYGSVHAKAAMSGPDMEMSLRALMYFDQDEISISLFLTLESVFMALLQTVGDYSSAAQNWKADAYSPFRKRIHPTLEPPMAPGLNFGLVTGGAISLDAICNNPDCGPRRQGAEDTTSRKFYHAVDVSIQDSSIQQSWITSSSFDCQDEVDKRTHCPQCHDEEPQDHKDRVG